MFWSRRARVTIDICCVDAGALCFYTSFPFPTAPTRALTTSSWNRTHPKLSVAPDPLCCTCLSSACAGVLVLVCTPSQNLLHAALVFSVFDVLDVSYPVEVLLVFLTFFPSPPLLFKALRLKPLVVSLIRDPPYRLFSDPHAYASKLTPPVSQRIRP